MPTPVLLSPLTLRLLAVGGAALATAVWRARRAPSSVPRDDMMDDIDDGVAMAAERVVDARGEHRQATMLARARRVIRLGRAGPGVEVDLSAMIRGRVRPAPRVK